jgi:hypothetical protein
MPGPLGTTTNSPNLDAGTMCLQRSPTPGPIDASSRKNSSDLTALDELLRATRSDLSAMSAQVIRDAPVREAYMQEVERRIAEIRSRFNSGRISHIEAAAAEANEFRNAALETMRSRTSPLGLVVAKNIKEEGVTLNDAIAKYTIKLFGKEAQFAALSAEQQGQVYAKILERAAITNADVSMTLRRLGPACRGLFWISMAYTVYTVATSDDKPRAIAKEGASLGLSIAGGAAGGAVAGLMCGPGAPVCVTAGAFIGGGLAALGVQIAFDSLGR